MDEDKILVNNETGEEFTYEEIEANKKAYLDNVPLHREEVEALIAAEKKSV